MEAQLLRQTQLFRVPSSDFSQFINMANNNTTGGGDLGSGVGGMMSAGLIDDNTTGVQIPTLLAQGMNMRCSMTLSDSDMTTEPSSIKHAKSFSMTTCKALCEIVTEIRRMLDSRQPALIYNNQENVFALQQNGVMMEMEVCQVPGLPALNGLKLRKIAGDTGQYKELCQDMLKAINL